VAYWTNLVHSLSPAVYARLTQTLLFLSAILVQSPLFIICSGDMVDDLNMEATAAV